MKQYKIGIVLSGGGARGIAHIGILQALEEAGIFPEVIAGSSAGSIAGAFYAHGYSPQEMLQIIKEIGYLRAIRPGIGRMGLIHARSLEKVLRKYVTKTFEELDKKLYVCATSLRWGDARYFSSGDVVTPVVASSAVPVMVTPVTIDDELYTDGGVVNNFPIDPIEGSAELLLGAAVNPISYDRGVIRSMKSVAERTFFLTLRQNEKERKERVDWLVEPQELYKYGILDVRKADKIYKIGYEATLRRLEEQNPLDQLPAAIKIA